MKKLFVIISVLVLVLTPFMVVANISNCGSYNLLQTASLSSHAFSENTEESICTFDQMIYSTATMDDDFCDGKIIVVLNRQASRDLRYFSTRDFPELRLSSVRDISPGLELARNQARVMQNREKQASGVRMFAEHELQYDKDWSVDLGNFRQIISLTLQEPGRENVLRAIRLLERRSDIVSAEPNFYETLYMPTLVEIDSCNDGMSFEPASASYPWGINIINTSAARNLISNPALVRVGVMDTGICANHPSLSGRLDTNLFRNFTNDNHNVFRDQHGHGTHVAGAIAGHRVGVAHQNIRMVSLRVLNTYSGGGNVYDQINAIYFATNLPENQRIHILNASLGGRVNHPGRMNAINQFPGLFVAAAGNSSQNNDIHPSFPANHRLPNLISVGATTANDSWASFSNWGATTVCIFAPGNGILSTFPTHRCDAGSFLLPSSVRRCEHNHGTILPLPSTMNGTIHHSRGYHLWSGTSMAAPHVAGVAALVMSANQSLKDKPDIVRNILIGTVDWRSNLSSYSVSGGRLNAYRAVRAAVNIEFYSGAGTLSDPFEISTPTHLYNIRFFPNSHFRLINSINLSSITNWTPIPVFRGTLDGNGYGIGDMRISRTSTHAINSPEDIGLFGRIYGTVSNLALGGMSIYMRPGHNGTEWIRAGALAGYIGAGGKVYNVGVLESWITVHRHQSVIGGIAGISFGTILDSQVALVWLMSNGDAGGLVGSTREGSVVMGNSVVHVEIRHWHHTNNRSVGGLVGLGHRGDIIDNAVLGSHIHRRNPGGTNIGALVGYLRPDPSRELHGNLIQGNTLRIEYCFPIFLTTMFGRT